MPVTKKKPRLIHMLSYILSVESWDILHTAPDAVVSPVETAMTFAKQQDIVIAEDDTDILVPLCAQADIGPNWICFHLDPKSNIKGPSPIGI